MAASAQLEILMKPAGSGKTTAALALYRDVLGACRPLGARRRALWLAPTRAAAADVRDALASGGQAFLDPGVTTFAGFAATVVWDAGLRVREISTLQRRRLLREIIAEANADGALGYFGRVADTAGLVNLVDEAIARLKRRDVSADTYGSRGGSPRQQELAELYRRYEERLAAGELVDAEGLFLAARDGARSVPVIATGLELVIVDGFSDFTAAQLELLQILTQRARRIIVTLVGEADGRQRPELFAKTQATRAALTQMGAADSGLSVPPASPSTVSSGPNGSPQPPVPAALRHLERNLFRDYADFEPLSPASRQSLDRIQVIAASSVQAEIEEIARRVKRLLVDGVPPGDVVVAFRSTHDVADRVRGTFDDFGIPLYVDAPRRLAATPLVRSLLNVLRLHVEDWPYRRLLHVVGDRSLSAFNLEATVEQWPLDGGASRAVEGRTHVEWCVRHAQQPAGRHALLGQVGAWATDDSGLGGVDATVAAAADGLLRSFAESLDALPQRAGIKGWISAVERLGLSLGLLGGGLDGASDPLPSPPHKGEGARRMWLGSWAALVDGLQAIQRIDDSTGPRAAELSASDFVDLVWTVANELAAPDQRDATGRVRVLSADGARFVRPRHLFVGGLSEQAFATSRRAGAFSLGEDEGEQPDAGDDMLLFYQLVTRPTETLTLSYPALDAKAQAMPASPFLIELQRCFADEIQEITQPLGYQARHEGPPLSRGELRQGAVAGAQARQRELLAALVRSPRYGRVGQSLLDGIEAVASRGDRRAFGAYEGLLASDAVRAILERRYGPEHLWSPSKLETYAACPFKFFSENVLSLAPAPELVLESDMARRGSVLHDTLARLYALLNAAAEEGGPTPTPELVAHRFQEALDAIVQSRPRRGIDGVLREIERRQIAAWAEQFAQQHDDYAAAWQHLDAPLAPKYFEARFGPKHRRSESADDATLSTEKPFELTVGEERMRFTGQIDRIDVGRVGDAMVFNVIDYKTSAAARVNPKHIEAGTQIQLPLYAMAAAELLLADKKAAALSAGYWSIRGKGFGAGARSGGPLAIGEIRDGKVEVAAGWTELRQTLLARIADIVTGIRGGSFPVFNEDKNCGQFCPFSTVCRVAHVRSLEKTWPPADGNASSSSLPLVGMGPTELGRLEVARAQGGSPCEATGEGGEPGTRIITPP